VGVNLNGVAGGPGLFFLEPDTYEEIGADTAFMGLIFYLR
jgi:hypothetical protein